MLLPTREALEPRRLLSASLAGSTLSIVGTPLADIVVLNQDATNVYVSENGAAPQVFPSSQIQQIQIDLGAGNDQVSLQKKNGTQRVNRPANVIGGKGDDFLRGGMASDAISGGVGNDPIDGSAGADSLVGSAGNDAADYSSRTKNLSI